MHLVSESASWRQDAVEHNEFRKENATGPEQFLKDRESYTILQQVSFR